MANQHLSVPPNLGGPQRLTSPSFTAKPQNQHNHTQQGPHTQHNTTAKDGTKSLKSEDKIDGLNGQKSPRKHQKQNVAEDEIDRTDSLSIGSDNVITDGKKIVGTVVIYDDMEASSSADSTNAAYGSKFKMWSKMESDNETKKPIEVKSNSKFKMWSKEQNSDQHSTNTGTAFVGEKTNTTDFPSSAALFEDIALSSQNVVSSSLPQSPSKDRTNNPMGLDTRLGSLDGGEVTFDVQKKSYAAKNDADDDLQTTLDNNGVSWGNNGEESFDVDSQWSTSWWHYMAAVFEKSVVKMGNF